MHEFVHGQGPAGLPCLGLIGPGWPGGGAAGGLWGSATPPIRLGRAIGGGTGWREGPQVAGGLAPHPGQTPN